MNKDTRDPIDVFAKHVHGFEQRLSNQGILPRAQNWRPHRFCVRDVVLALVVTRLNSRLGITEVDLFATYDPEVFEDYVGTRIATSFILSDAFMSGGTMEIHFTRNFGKEKVFVPGILFDFAFEQGIELKHAMEGVITSSEAKQLYFALTNLSPAAKSSAAKLHNDGLVTSERVCFMVNSQTWQPEEMEMILRGAKYPERVLLGTTHPLERQLYLADLFQASGAMLGTYLTKKMLQKETLISEGHAIDLEADEKRLAVGFDPRFYAKTYQLNESLVVPWIHDEDDEVELPAGSQMTIMVRPRSRGYIKLFGENDLNMMAKMAREYREATDWLGIMYPEDFRFLTPSEQLDFTSKAANLGVTVIVCPEILEVIDSNAIDKLNRSNLMRR